MSLRVLVVASAMFALNGAALAQSVAETENGRFTMLKSGDGMMRLDTRNGAVSTCTNKDAGWACYAIPDERAALDAEIGRLQKDNEDLRAQLAKRDAVAENKTNETSPKSEPAVPSVPRAADKERKIEIPLPSEKDVDRVMGLLENAWRRLVDVAARIQRDASGKI